MHSTRLEKILSSKKVRLGYSFYPRYCEKDSKGLLTGFAIDLSKELTYQMNVEAEFIPASWQNFFQELAQDQYDLHIGPAFNTIERSLEADFPEAYGQYNSLAGLVHTQDLRFQTVEDLNIKDITIAVPQKWYAHEFANRHLTEPSILVDHTEGPENIFNMLYNQEVDIALADGPSVEAYLKTNKDYELKALFLDPAVVLVQGGFAVQKNNNEWCKFLSNAINCLKLEGVVQQLARKYQISLLG